MGGITSRSVAQKLIESHLVEGEPEPGEEIGIRIAVAPARAMLLGGVPFSKQLLMWWNFVARTSQEIDGAYESWQDGDVRFGEVASRLDRIPAPRPTWTSGQRER
jgi:redox-sensitive bicupin YhaK (pirin superfamily)